LEQGKRDISTGDGHESGYFSNRVPYIFVWSGTESESAKMALENGEIQFLWNEEAIYFERMQSI
jgi:hypothetical protein